MGSRHHSEDEELTDDIFELIQDQTLTYARENTSV